MVEIADIVDRDSLRMWLDGQPREVAVWIAHRSAMRLLPLWWDFVQNDEAIIGESGDLNVLPILQLNLISGVARKNPKLGIKYATLITSNLDALEIIGDTIEAAMLRAGDAGFTSHFPFSAAIETPTAANDAVGTIIEADYASLATNVVSIAISNYIAANAMRDAAADANDPNYAARSYTEWLYWTFIQIECEAITTRADLGRLKLWGDQVNPYEQIWADVKARLPTANPLRSEVTAHGALAMDWSFWVKWYDDALNGNPPNWDMLERIALIDPAEWGKGAKRVNFLIGEIEKEFAWEATPYPENLTYDGEYHVAPISELPTRTLEDARDRIADVSRDMRKGGNQYSALGDEADVLDDVLERYPDRAIRLFEVCHKVVGHVVRYVENGVLPEGDNLIDDVLGDLQNSADDIYNFDADVRVAVDARAKLRFGRLDQGQRDTVVALAAAVAQNSDAELAEEIREDAAEVMVADDPEGESKPARYRLGSRLVRVFALGGIGMKKVYAVLGIVGTVGGGASVLWALVKFLIGF